MTVKLSALLVPREFMTLMSTVPFETYAGMVKVSDVPLEATLPIVCEPKVMTLLRRSKPTP